MYIQHAKENDFVSVAYDINWYIVVIKEIGISNEDWVSWIFSWISCILGLCVAPSIGQKNEIFVGCLFSMLFEKLTHLFQLAVNNINHQQHVKKDSQSKEM